MKRLRLNNKQKLAVVKRARALIRKPSGWRKGTYRTRSKNPKTGYAFCLHGACNQALRDLYPDAAEASAISHNSEKVAQHISVASVVKDMHNTSIIRFNDADKTKKSDVIAVLDARIAQLEAEIAAESAA